MKTVIFIIIAIIGVTSSIFTNNHIKERQCYEQQMTEIRQKLHKKYEEKQYLDNLKSQDTNLSIILCAISKEIQKSKEQCKDASTLSKLYDEYDKLYEERSKLEDEIRRLEPSQLFIWPSKMFGD